MTEKMKVYGYARHDEKMTLHIGDRVVYRKDGKLYEGVIKSFQGEKVEIDDSTVKLKEAKR